MPDEQPASPGAPFIPPDVDTSPVPPTPWRVFGTKTFFRLWLAQVISSLGDWIGLIAILAIAARVSNNSGAAVSLVMTTRVLPGFLLGTLGGVIIDRFDRRKVMVLCDVGRASLLVLLPFAENLVALVLISLGLELMTLLWGPAQAATVPHFVKEEQLASANSLSLAASYGTFPIASIIFSLLAGLATVLGRLDIISSFKVDQEMLALLFDATTFLVSAAIVWRLPFPKRERGGGRRIDWPDTFSDIKEGLHFIGHNPLVRGVIIGLGFGLIGGGAMIPLGPSFAKEVLLGGSAAFGVLMTALGFGAAFGVVTLLWLQGRLPRSTVFSAAVVGTGVFLILAASVSSLAPAALFIGGVGACAGTSYVTGFTVLQENVGDDLRGRIFATLYTVIRLCLLVSLTISPLWSDFWDFVTTELFDDQAIAIGPYVYALPGVRISLWGGGLITLAAGLFAWQSIARARRDDPEGEERAAERLRAEADADVARVQEEEARAEEKAEAAAAGVVDGMEPAAAGPVTEEPVTADEVEASEPAGDEAPTEATPPDEAPTDFVALDEHRNEEATG